MSTFRLAIITTHPIQYNAPFFAMLSSRGRIAPKVFYTWGNVLNNQYDPGFGKDIEWDIPLLTGYDHTFVKNISTDPGSHHFKGIDNPTLVEEILAWKADAILVYGWSFKSHLKVMRFFHGKVPVLFRGDSTLLKSSSPIKAKIRKIFLAWVYAHVDYALYVGSHNREYYKAFGLKDVQLIFAPHAVDNDRFYAQSENLEERAKEWKKSLGIESGHLVMLYAGKLDDNKNVAMAADAFVSLNYTKAHFIIAGNGINEEFLKKKYAGREGIHFLPFQNQSVMPLLYRLGDAFILPSLSETWGLSINEAMACSRAIMASSACGAAVDLVRDGINGYVFRSNDISDLVVKIKLIMDKSVLSEMGGNSREIIKPWNFESTCIAVENLVNGKKR